jgi:hypothetical protein
MIVSHLDINGITNGSLDILQQLSEVLSNDPEDESKSLWNNLISKGWIIV